MSNTHATVTELIRKSGAAATSHDALHYSQAAVNVANALRQQADTPAAK